MLQAAVPVVLNQFASFFAPNPTAGTKKTLVKKDVSATSSPFFPWLIGGGLLLLFLIFFIFRKR